MRKLTVYSAPANDDEPIDAEWEEVPPRARVAEPPQPVTPPSYKPPPPPAAFPHARVPQQPPGRGIVQPQPANVPAHAPQRRPIFLPGGTATDPVVIGFVYFAATLAAVLFLGFLASMIFDATETYSKFVEYVIGGLLAGNKPLIGILLFFLCIAIGAAAVERDEARKAALAAMAQRGRKYHRQADTTYGEARSADDWEIDEALRDQRGGFERLFKN